MVQNITLHSQQAVITNDPKRKDCMMHACIYICIKQYAQPNYHYVQRTQYKNC